MTNVECANTPLGPICKRQDLFWDLKAWRTRLDELKIEFKTASRRGNVDKQGILLEEMETFKGILDGINRELQETDPSICKNCPRD